MAPSLICPFGVFLTFFQRTQGCEISWSQQNCFKTECDNHCLTHSKETRSHCSVLLRVGELCNVWVMPLEAILNHIKRWNESKKRSWENSKHTGGMNTYPVLTFCKLCCLSSFNEIHNLFAVTSCQTQTVSSRHNIWGLKCKDNGFPSLRWEMVECPWPWKG